VNLTKWAIAWASKTNLQKCVDQLTIVCTRVRENVSSNHFSLKDRVWVYTMD
jgi:hypothetical protein